jgi:alpha-N-arabinofuranosidase
VIAPIMTNPSGGAWRQTIFHPFALSSRYARGDVLDLAVAGPSISTPAFGKVSQLLSTATFDSTSGELTIFAVNRSRTEPIDISARLNSFTNLHFLEHLELHEEDHTATNTESDPDRVVPHTGKAQFVDATLSATLPPVSWHCFRLLEGDQS